MTRTEQPFENIWDFFKSEIMVLIKDINNYSPKSEYFVDSKYLVDNKLKCQACNQDITRPVFPDYFLLWTKDDEYYICFHFRCALKKEAESILDDLIINFDFISLI